MQRLERLLSAYESMFETNHETTAPLFVLMGKFISQIDPLSSTGRIHSVQCFQQLAHLLQVNCPVLSKRSKFILVPGTDSLRRSFRSLISVC